jgi:hypothetical protein
LLDGLEYHNVGQVHGHLHVINNDVLT